MRQVERVGKFLRSIPQVLALFLSAGLMLSCMTSEGLTSGEDAGKTLELSPIDISSVRFSAVPVGNYAFDNARDWAEFCSKYHKTAEPEIDFGKHTLVAVVLGQKPNPGYSVKIAGATERDGEIIVDIIEYLPSPGMMYAQVIVYPYDAALIPRTGAPIRFEVTKKTGRP